MKNNRQGGRWDILLTQGTLTAQGLNQLNGLTIIMQSIHLVNRDNKQIKYYKFKNEETFKGAEGESAITYIEQAENEVGLVLKTIATTLGRQKGNKNIQIIQGTVGLVSDIKHLNGVKRITYEEYRNELTRLIDKWNEITGETSENIKKIAFQNRYSLYWQFGHIREIPVILFDSYKTIIDNERNEQKQE